jgi:hypothetical protein
MSSKIRGLWDGFESSGLAWSKINYEIEDEDEDEFSEFRRVRGRRMEDGEWGKEASTVA